MKSGDSSTSQPVEKKIEPASAQSSTENPPPKTGESLPPSQSVDKKEESAPTESTKDHKSGENVDEHKTQQNEKSSTEVSPQQNEKSSTSQPAKETQNETPNPRNPKEPMIPQESENKTISKNPTTESQSTSTPFPQPAIPLPEQPKVFKPPVDFKRQCSFTKENMLGQAKTLNLVHAGQAVAWLLLTGLAYFAALKFFE